MSEQTYAEIWADAINETPELPLSSWPERCHCLTRTPIIPGLLWILGLRRCAPMSNVAERASAIRHYLRNHADRSLARKYSFVAARYEEMKLAQIAGNSTPADDAAFREVTEMLSVLTKRLDLAVAGDGITGWNGFLPGDPQRVISDSWLESARLWFGSSA
jgi:hypothetical protein